MTCSRCLLVSDEALSSALAGIARQPQPTKTNIDLAIATAIGDGASQAAIDAILSARLAVKGLYDDVSIHDAKVSAVRADEVPELEHLSQRALSTEAEAQAEITTIGLTQVEPGLFVVSSKVASPSAPSPQERESRRRTHMAVNVAIRRLGGIVPACDGPDCPVCAALAAPPEGWQDMKSAPKDGTRILVAFDHIGVFQVFWSEEPYSVPGLGSWCVTDNKHEDRPLRGYVEADERGWMPLPAPPLAASGSGETEP